MKMTTDIKHKYYEFKVPDNEYYALIAAGNEAKACADYYEDVVGSDYDGAVGCQKIPTSLAWKKLASAGLSEESTMRVLINQFDQSGLLLVSAALG